MRQNYMIIVIKNKIKAYDTRKKVLSEDHSILETVLTTLVFVTVILVIIKKLLNTILRHMIYGKRLYLKIILIYR